MKRPAANASTQDKMIYADMQGSHWLAKANETYEGANTTLADKYYDKGQYWLDLYNRLAGNL